MSNQRDVSLDIIRILACLMVIAMHAPMPSDNAIGIFNVALSYYTAPCIGLFFMVSGALLLPIKSNGIDFLKKRFSKIVIPTLFWSLFYIACKYFDNGMEYGNLVRSILSIPFSAQGHGVMWFMYTLAGLYLIAPIISAWLERASKRELEIYILLWLLSTCYPIISLVLTTQSDNTNILYYLSGFVGYFILGYYLTKYPDTISNMILIPSTLIAMVAPIVCKILGWEVNFYEMFWYLSIFVVAMTIAIFKLITKYSDQCAVGNIVTNISNLSFGIYLTHIFIMRFVLWRCDFILNINSHILQTIVVIILTFIESLGLSYIIAKLPMGNYIIGYKIKKNR